MRIAIASSDWSTVSGHAGRARHWLLYEIGEKNAMPAPRRVELASDMVFHVFKGDGPHPLDGIDALIAASSGEGFARKMTRKGIDVRMTGETDPERAVRAYLEETLSPPRPRPIGALVCKVVDLFSHHD